MQSMRFQPLYILNFILLLLPSTVFAITPISLMQANSHLNRAMLVLEEVMQIDSSAIPAQLMQRAHGLIISPNPFPTASDKIEQTHRLAVAITRNAQGDWGEPLFISFISSYDTDAKDVILVLQDEQVISNIDQLPVDLCATKPILAGAVGRNNADLSPLAKIFGYIREQGYLQGILLTHAVLKPEPIYNKALYNRHVTAAEVFGGKVQPHSRAVKRFKTVISKYTQ